MDSAALKKRQTNRYAFLRAMFDATGGSTSAYANMFEVGRQIGLSDEEVREASDYLRGEHLIEGKYLGGGMGITHAGIREVEESISEPEESTEHFEPSVFNVYNQTFHAAVGAVQIGDHNVANVVQTINQDARTLIQQLRTEAAKLPDKDRQAAEEHIGVIEQHAAEPSKNRVVLKSLLGTLVTAFGTALPAQLPTIVDALTKALGLA